MGLMISFLGLLLDVAHQEVPRDEASEEVEGMQNALALLVAIVLIVILLVTLIAMWRRR